MLFLCIWCIWHFSINFSRLPKKRHRQKYCIYREETACHYCSARSISFPCKKTHWLQLQLHISLIFVAACWYIRPWIPGVCVPVWDQRPGSPTNQRHGFVWQQWPHWGVQLHCWARLLQLGLICICAATRTAELIRLLFIWPPNKGELDLGKSRNWKGQWTTQESILMLYSVLSEPVKTSWSAGNYSWTLLTLC